LTLFNSVIHKLLAFTRQLFAGVNGKKFFLTV